MMETPVNAKPSSRAGAHAALIMLVVAGLAAGLWALLESRGAWPRSEALGAALQPIIGEQGSDRAMVARIIWDSYLETRANAVKWSGVYWGCTFAAALLSALAALILKLETFVKGEALKKDLAAAFAVAAALLVTVSTSGDFQRKWQANRIAAAELEHTGYIFLEKNGAEARSYLAAVRETLLRRQMAIVGDTQKPATPEPVDAEETQTK